LNTSTIQQQTFAAAKRIYWCIYCTIVHWTSNRHVQAVMNNLKFIILDYLAAKKSGILGLRKDFCGWSISSHSIWKVMPFRHLTEYNTLRDTRTLDTDQ